jgi:hypothetical protein
MSPPQCPQGHVVGEDERFCPVCGFEREDLADPGYEVEHERILESVRDTEAFHGALTLSTLLYVLAAGAFVVGVALTIDFISIVRVHGSTRLEVIGAFEILIPSLVLTVILVALGYITEMVKVLTKRTPEPGD